MNTNSEFKINQQVKHVLLNAGVGEVIKIHQSANTITYDIGVDYMFEENGEVITGNARLYNVEKKMLRPIGTPFKNLSIEQFIWFLKNNNPEFLYNAEWHRSKPLGVITGKIQDGDTGVWMYWESWGDKTPTFFPWDKLYKEMKSSGLENWDITRKTTSHE